MELACCTLELAAIERAAYIEGMHHAPTLGKVLDLCHQLQDLQDTLDARIHVAREEEFEKGKEAGYAEGYEDGLEEGVAEAQRVAEDMAESLAELRADDMERRSSFF